MPPRTAPPERSSLAREKSTRTPKPPLRFEDDQTDRDRRARERKERAKKSNDIIDPAKKQEEQRNQTIALKKKEGNRNSTPIIEGAYEASQGG
jgi:hypothetical protein